MIGFHTVVGIFFNQFLRCAEFVLIDIYIYICVCVCVCVRVCIMYMYAYFVYILLISFKITKKMNACLRVYFYFEHLHI